MDPIFDILLYITIHSTKPTNKYYCIHLKSSGFSNLNEIDKNKLIRIVISKKRNLWDIPTGKS